MTGPTTSLRSTLRFFRLTRRCHALSDRQRHWRSRSLPAGPPRRGGHRRSQRSAGDQPARRKEAVLF
jgi:hypothetical protein